MVCMVKDPEYEEEIREDLYKVRVPNLEVWKGFQDLTASYLKLEEGKNVPDIKRCEVFHGYLPGRAGTVARQSEPLN